MYYVCCVFNVLYLLCIQCCRSCEAQHKIKFKKINKMLSLVFVTWILESCILIHYLGSPWRLKYYFIFNHLKKNWSTTMTITSLRFCCLKISKHVKCACPPKCKELGFERFLKPKAFFFQRVFIKYLGKKPYIYSFGFLLKNQDIYSINHIPQPNYYFKNQIPTHTSKTLGWGHSFNKGHKMRQ